MYNVIVTGAGGGMGRALVAKLSEKYLVTAVDRNADKLAVFSELKTVRCLVADIAGDGWIPKLDAFAEGHQVYGIINLAGLSCGNSIDSLTDEDWETSFQVNVTAPMRLIRWATPHFVKHKQGRVINVGSPVGIVGARKASYAASKSALTGLTMSVARELGKCNVCVNQLLPGPTITDMTQDWPEDKRNAIAKGSFLNRLCTPEEIADMVMFLLSEQCSYMTGAVIDMTSGSMLGH